MAVLLHVTCSLFICDYPLPGVCKTQAYSCPNKVKRPAHEYLFVIS